MDARAGAAEEAVVSAALSRGLLTAVQIDNARQIHAENVRAKQASSLLALLARHLRPEHRDELRKVYADALQAGGTSADAADAEATSLIDMPALVRPPSETLARPSGETLGVAAGPARASLLDPSRGPAASTFGSSPGSSTTPPPLAPTYMAPQPAATVRADKQATYMEPANPRTMADASVGAPIAKTLAVSPPAGAPPSEISGFTIVRELGRGGMGVVYEATHPTHGRVALKVLLAGELATAQDVERFKLEARSCASLSHPNIVRVYEHGQDSAGRWFMAMEFIGGESLEAVVAREGALQTLVAARIARDVALALHSAHVKSILHRDVKPHNVLMDGDTPRLTDFGLAKLVGDAKSRSLTNTGGVLGTPGYMAPEQAGGEGKKIDKRADVYGVGSLLYHLLTGRAPFEGDSLANVLVAVLQKSPVPLTQRRPGLPRDLETICFKCLEKDPANRYQSAKELADDLERFVGAQEINARPPGMLTLTLRAARAHGAAGAVAIAGALALAVGVVLAVRAQLPAGGGPVATATTTSEVPPPTTTPTTTTPTTATTTRRPTPVTTPTEAPPPTPTEAPLRATESPPPTPTESPPPTPTESPPPTPTESPPPTPTVTESPPPTLTVTESPPPTEAPPPTPTESPPDEPTPSAAEVHPPVLDERTAEWLDWRCRAMRQAEALGPTLQWAPSLSAAVEESHARNVPLVIVMIGFGDDPLPFFRDRAKVEMLNEDFVLLLAQKDENEDKDVHRTIEVEREARCRGQPTITCDQHNDARKDLRERRDLKEGARPLAHFPRERCESKDENCRLLVHVPGSSTFFAQLSDKPKEERVRHASEEAIATALVGALNTTGPARFPLSALADIVRADVQAHGKRFKRAITLLQDAARSEHELVRAFARRRLEVDLPGMCDRLILEARTLQQRSRARSELVALKGEFKALPACARRVQDALDSLR